MNRRTHQHKDIKHMPYQFKYSPDENVERALYQLKLRYGYVFEKLGIKVNTETVEASCVRGYWHVKGHNRIGSLYYAEPGIRDESGRFMSPYVAWRCWCDKYGGQTRDELIMESL